MGPEHNRTSVTPEEVGSHILKYLRNVAQTNLSSPVTKAVMSVPAEFSPEQRNATRKAAALAGMFNDVLTFKVVLYTGKCSVIRKITTMG